LSRSRHGHDPKGKRVACLKLGCTAVSVLLVVIANTANAADWRFAPRSRLFQPLLADPTETQFSILKYTNNSRLEGTIGGSWEAFDAKRANGSTVRIGIHAGVFTLLRKTGPTFPLEMTDFLFGLHTDVQQGHFSGRFEFAHVSAHLADGFSDPVRRPFTYSREYFTFYGAYSWHWLRVYSSLRLSNHAIPNIKRWRLQIGSEAVTRSLLGEKARMYAAYDLRIFNALGTVTNLTAHLGILFHSPSGSGLRAAIVGHSGRSEHGQFFDVRDQYIGLGLFLDL
jgi:hypothetical protein